MEPFGEGDPAIPPAVDRSQQPTWIAPVQGSVWSEPVPVQEATWTDPQAAPPPYGYPDPMYQNPMYPAPPPPPRPKNTRVVWASAGAVLAVALIVVIALVATSGGGKPGGGLQTLAASSTPTEPTPTPVQTTTEPPAPTTPPDDPSTWDSSTTDKTPFTSDALLPQTFTDSKGVLYLLESAGGKSCVQGDMTTKVQSVLNANNCIEVMTGQYTVSSSTVTSKSDILVSVQIFAFADAATATQVMSNFPDGSSWDFGIWCTAQGDGANPCASGKDYRNAEISESINTDHRYLIEVSSLYTDLSSSSSCKEWTAPATQEALASVGPQVFAQAS